MFLELTSDGEPLLVNTNTIEAIRPLHKGEGDNPAYKTLVLFFDESGYFVDQVYTEIAKQIPHTKIVTTH